MGKASREFLRQARRQVPEWSPAQVKEALTQQGEAKQDVVLIDIREKHEWNEAYIPGAIHLPRGFLEFDVEENVPDKEYRKVVGRNPLSGGHATHSIRLCLSGAQRHRACRSWRRLEAQRRR